MKNSFILNLMHAAFKATSLLFGIALSTLALAEDSSSKFIPIPESGVEKYLVESQYGPEDSVLNLSYPRDGKLEVSGGYVYSPFSSLAHYQGWSGNLTLHINRRHAIEPLYFVDQSAKMTSFVKSEIRDKLDAATKNSQSFEVPDQSFAASYLFSPFYSKMHITERTVTHFDVYLGAGAGIVRAYPLTLSGTAGTVKSVPSGLLTMGMRFLFPTRFGLRLELRDFIHNENNFGKSVTGNSLQISLSTSIFFGAF